MKSIALAVLGGIGCLLVVLVLAAGTLGAPAPQQAPVDAPADYVCVRPEHPERFENLQDGVFWQYAPMAAHLVATGEATYCR